MLEVKNLCKEYPTFRLDNISFHLKKGYITGFIGANGAGKTTTMKCIMNLVRPTSGEVKIMGRSLYDNEVDLKQDIGFMLGPVDYYMRSKISTLIKVYKRFYKNWSDKTFDGLMKKFHLDQNKRVIELSAGMKVKLGIAMALSHGAKLIILDEPTSGLDPVARDELLDLFQSIVEDGEHSILFSTHITSDLDKCADYIIYIAGGKMVAEDTRDDLIATHALICGTLEELTPDLQSRVIAAKKNRYGFTALVRRANLSDEELTRLKAEAPNLEDLMVYYSREQEEE